jgi:hypothetical protein
LFKKRAAAGSVYGKLDYHMIQGGNVNFWITHEMVGQLQPFMKNNRIPGIPSLHIKYDDKRPYIHLDTANPESNIPFGVLGHFFIDILLGNINGRVPMIR